MASESSAIKRRRTRTGDVLEAALEMFHVKGYAGTSIQDVADRVGVLKGSLYHYIDSKEDLLFWIFEDSDRQSQAIIKRVTELDAPAIERLRAFAESWALWYLENIERASLYFNEWRHLSGERLEAVVQQRRSYEQFTIELIDAAVKEGDARRDLDPRFACFFILSSINGLPTWYRRRGPEPAAVIAGIYADMVVGLVRGEVAAR